jgi:hypothetical protein
MRVGAEERWLLEQVQHDGEKGRAGGAAKKATFAWRGMDSGLRRDEEKKKRLK